MNSRILGALVSVALVVAACAAPKPKVTDDTGELTHELAQSPHAVPEVRAAGPLEVVAPVEQAMPTGVTVAPDGRVFLNFPRWGDRVAFTVAELRGERLVPYPDADTNRGSRHNFKDRFVSVQSVVVDPRGRLWVLDTGSINFGKVSDGAAKLVGFDLSTNKPIKTIIFPRTSVLPTTYLNDIRFDLRRGMDGTAYITDSSNSGPNGIIVVDLASGQSWRRLHDHSSTKAERGFVPTVEGAPLMVKSKEGVSHLKIGADGIAISADGKHLYYCPLASRRLYRVSIDALTDRSQSEAQVAATVEDLGDRGFASDGLESDAAGNIYLTDYENNSIRARTPAGEYRTVISDPRMIWPDTISLGHDGYLYFTANQLNRQALFHGKDKRVPPYLILRTKIYAQPVVLK